VGVKVCRGEEIGGRGVIPWLFCLSGGVTAEKSEESHAGWSRVDRMCDDGDARCATFRKESESRKGTEGG